MATKRPRFKVGDTVFYPSAGVGAILAVEDIYHSGQVESCFVIRIQDTQMTVKVPRSNLERSGIRPLLDGKKTQGTVQDFILQEQAPRHRRQLG